MSSIPVVGLDLSLGNTGIAIIKDGKLRTFSRGEKLPKEAGDGSKLMRLHRSARWAVDTIKGVVGDDPVRIGYEQYAFSGNGLTRLSEQSAVVRSQLYLNFATVPISLTAEESRKFLFGTAMRHADIKNKGSRKKAIKADVILRLIRLGYPEPDNADEADAAVIALVMNAYINERQIQLYGDYGFELFRRLDARGM